jgi:hypothetical protein
VVEGEGEDTGGLEDAMSLPPALRMFSPYTLLFDAIPDIPD